MTRLKTILKNAELLEVKEVKSKKGNNYQVLVVRDEESREINLYDPNILNLDINKFYDFELEIIISQYSNIKVLNVHEVKKGIFK